MPTDSTFKNRLGYDFVSNIISRLKNRQLSETEQLENKTLKIDFIYDSNEIVKSLFESYEDPIRNSPDQNSFFGLSKCYLNEKKDIS